MATYQVRTVEEHRFSDGTLGRVSVFLRKYSYLHTSNEWNDPGFSISNVNKDTAMKALADDIRDDVLDLD